MKLFESAWDGDVKCVKGLLEMGVPVNVARPVRTHVVSYVPVYNVPDNLLTCSCIYIVPLL